MNGSEKQINWATTIKAEVVELLLDEVIQKAITNSVAKGDSEARTNAKCAQLRKRITAAADTFEDARFWIDARLSGRVPCRETFAAMNQIRAKAVEMGKVAA